MASPDAPRLPVSLRPIEPDDMEFLCRLYGSTRETELAPIPWTAEEKEAFLRFQFNAQHKHYQEHYSGASFDVIELQHRPIGRLYMHRGASELRLMDIALLPDFQGRGIGTMLIQAVIAEASAAAKRITLYVEQDNPVRRLYGRLGFRENGETSGVYLMMELVPDSIGTNF